MYGNDDTVVTETGDGRATVANNQTSTGTETNAPNNGYFNNDTAVTDIPNERMTGDNSQTTTGAETEPSGKEQKGNVTKPYLCCRVSPNNFLLGFVYNVEIQLYYRKHYTRRKEDNVTRRTRWE